jgi:hypothetical protein
MDSAASPVTISTPGNGSPKGNTTIANLTIYNHSLTQGASEALNVQTFPLQICDITGIAVLRVNGFNMPLLLSINAHAPYLHRGQDQILAVTLTRNQGKPGLAVRADPEPSRCSNRRTLPGCRGTGAV